MTEARESLRRGRRRELSRSVRERIDAEEGDAELAEEALVLGEPDGLDGELRALEVGGTGEPSREGREGLSLEFRTPISNTPGIQDRKRRIDNAARYRRILWSWATWADGVQQGAGQGAEQGAGVPSSIM